MPDYEIDEKELSKLKENFDRFKVTITKLYNMCYRVEKHRRLLVMK